MSEHQNHLYDTMKTGVTRNYVSLFWRKEGPRDGGQFSVVEKRRTYRRKIFCLGSEEKNHATRRKGRNGSKKESIRLPPVPS